MEMDRSTGKDRDLPIACTLTPSELAERKERLLPWLLSEAVSRERIANGYRWRFNPADGVVTKAAAVIDAERRCCRFLRFRLDVEAGEGPVWFEVTGPEGTADFISSLVDQGA